MFFRFISILFLGLLILTYAYPAFAHSPYLIKHATVQDQEGNTYIIETRNGDGIFFVDPYVMQVRDRHGRVVAFHKAASLPVYCTSIDYCWALGGYPKKFDFVEIIKKSKELEQKNEPVEDMKLEKFQKYLSDQENKRFSGGSIIYPEYEKNTENFGIKQENLLLAIFLKPLAVIASVLLVPRLYIPSILFPFASAAFVYIRQRPIHRKFTGVIYGVIWLLYGCAILISLGAVSVTFILWPVVNGMYFSEYSIFAHFVLALGMNFALKKLTGRVKVHTSSNTPEISQAFLSQRRPSLFSPPD